MTHLIIGMACGQHRLDGRRAAIPHRGLVALTVGHFLVASNRSMNTRRRLVRWSTRSSIRYAGLISIASASEVRTSSHLQGARVLRAARRPARRKHSEKEFMRQVRQTNHDFKGNKPYDIPFEAVNVFGFRDFGQGLRSSRN